MKSRSRNAFIAAGIGIAFYALSWLYGEEVGLKSPMANLRYFYYGAAPASTRDKVLYVFHYPIYAIHLARQGDPENPRTEFRALV